MNDTPTGQLLSVAEAINYLRLSATTLARMRRDRNGPKYIKLGRRVMYRKADLDAYMDQNVIQQGEDNE